MKESRNQESTYTIYFQTSEIYQTDKLLIVSNITEVYSVSTYGKVAKCRQKDVEQQNVDMDLEILGNDILFVLKHSFACPL